VTTDQRLLDAYFEYATEQVRAGILNCARWERAMLADVSLEQFMIDELRVAGRLPEGWDE
jgi:hypothetical protein